MNETAEQAIERLKQVIEKIKQDKNLNEVLDDAESYRESLDDLIAPYARKKDNITEKQIQAEEERLSVILPISYKHFILKYGLIKFGKNNHFNRKMFFPLSDLGNEKITTSWKYHIAEMKGNYGEDVMKKFSKMYAFSYGDEELNSEWFHLFDFNKVNTRTNDVPIINFDTSTKYGILENIDNGGVVHKNFDEYMSWAVNQQINLIEQTKENYE